MNRRIRARWQALDRVDIGCTVAALIALLVAALPLGGLSIVASVIGGAVITFGGTRYYYRRAGEELRAESRDLRHYINVLMDSFKDAGYITFERDASGRPIRVRILKLRGGGIASTPSVGGGEVTASPPEDPREEDPPQSHEEGERQE